MPILIRRNASDTNVHVHDTKGIYKKVETW